MPSNFASSFIDQVAYYVGLNLLEVLYGIDACLYFKTMYILLYRRRFRQKSDAFYAAFSSVTFALITVYVTLQVVTGQDEWLPNITYPGGPAAFVQRPAAHARLDAVAVIAIILQQMTNALMIHRCRIVWNSVGIIAIPSVLWLVTLALGILATWAAGTTTSNVFSVHAYQFGLAYYSISVFLDAVLTGTIGVRLVGHARTMRKRFRGEYAAPCFSIVGLAVESMLPLTLIGIAFLVTYGVRNVSKNALLLVYVLMMAVSSQLLILRVAEGTAWQKETMETRIPVVMFRSHSEDTPSSEDRNGDVPVIRVGSLSGASSPESVRDSKV